MSKPLGPSLEERDGNEPKPSNVRFCIDIDVELAFDHCSAAFSAAWKGLTPRQISPDLRAIGNPRIVRVAYSDRPV